jgi:hypothetical protein
LSCFYYDRESYFERASIIYALNQSLFLIIPVVDSVELALFNRSVKGKGADPIGGEIDG